MGHNVVSLKGEYGMLSVDKVILAGVLALTGVIFKSVCRRSVRQLKIRSIRTHVTHYGAGPRARQLRKRIAKGEEEACAELIRSHHAAIYRFACYLCKEMHFAEDITQETFLAAWSMPYPRLGTRGCLRKNLKARSFSIIIRFTKRAHMPGMRKN